MKLMQRYIGIPTGIPGFLLYHFTVFCVDLLLYQLYVAAGCHLFLHACNRSLFEHGLSIDSRANVISQHARWPIRAPLPTCANQDA